MADGNSGVWDSQQIMVGSYMNHREVDSCVHMFVCVQYWLCDSIINCCKPWSPQV